MFTSLDDAPAQYDTNRHICWFQWRVEKPFEGIDDRVSIAVTHNCPEEFIESIEFNLQPVLGSGYTILDDDTDRSDIPAALSSIVVKAKTAAGEGNDSDFGYWHADAGV